VSELITTFQPAGTVMQRRPSILLICVWSLIAGGCAATGERFTGLQSPSSSEALLVLYRLDLFRAGGNSLKVFVDDKEIGILRNAGWISARIAPGHRSITVDQRFDFGQKASMPVVAKAGETVVIRVLPGGMTGIVILPTAPVLTFGPWTMQRVTHEIANVEMQGLKRSD
jgi:hypothetical protein